MTRRPTAHLRLSGAQPPAGDAPEQLDWVTPSHDTHVAGLPYVASGQADGSLCRLPAGDPKLLRDELDEAGISLVAVRHGQTRANAESEKLGEAILCGQVESPLTATGRQQAVKAAASLYQALGGEQWLKAALRDPSKFPVIFASPLSRAHDTARATTRYIVAQARQLEHAGHLPLGSTALAKRCLPIHLDPRLLEISFGQYELKRRHVLAHDLPSFTENWDSYQGRGVDFTDAFPGGESRMMVLRRMNSFLEELPFRCPGRSVLMFTHAETIVAAETALGWTPERDGILHVAGKSILNATPYALTDVVTKAIARPQA